MSTSKLKSARARSPDSGEPDPRRGTILNAAFLGNLSSEAQRILGFGDKTRYIPAFQRKTEHRVFYQTMDRVFNACVGVSDFKGRAVDRLKRILQRKN